MMNRLKPNASVAGLAISVFILVLSLSRGAHAQELGFLSGDAADSLSVGFDEQFDAAPESSSGLWFEEQRANVNVPVRIDGDSSYALVLRGQRTFVGNKLRFASRAIDIPEEFGSGEAVFVWNRKDGENGRTAASLGVGRAGRRLLDNGTTPIATANVFVERLQPDGNSWLFFVSYANNRAIYNNVPIPGVAYSINGKVGKLIVGLPFVFGLWRSDPVVVNALVSPFVASTEASYRVHGPFMIYVGGAWRPKAYQNLLAGSEDRLIFEKKEASLGVRMFLSRQSSIALGYVRSFDRRFVLGRSLRDVSSEVLTLADGDGVQFKIKHAF